eukprot:TRINITY_DN8377_c0_g5_i1.p1 TRINITY_DN8377_c0_g5~~TRINITY_DN8377_c0_g5_i1.p1  ORF type:complete len:256 (-),score=60.55 TRINITY_DN8377_c0_g5_i1:189-956(-)
MANKRSDDPNDRNGFNDRFASLGQTGFADEDRVNCPFYTKIGACRNGDRCNRAHVRPEKANALLIPHLYPCIPEAMSVAGDEDWDDETYARQQEHLENFYEEIWMELSKYGEVEDVVVVDNVSEHMLGNVYIKYVQDEHAAEALKHLSNRFYGSRLIQAEYTPVTDFREARCRAFHETRCSRGGLCNFMHVKHIPKATRRRVMRQMYELHPSYSGAKAALANRPPTKKRKAEAEPATAEERKAKIAQWNKELFGR